MIFERLTTINKERKKERKKEREKLKKNKKIKGHTGI